MEKNDSKKTIGQQLDEKIIKNINDIGPEAREVTLEWGKKFLDDLEDIIKDPKFKNFNKLYIKVLAKKTIASEKIVSVVYGVTDFPPSPAWKTMLYTYSRIKDEWRLEWVLPQAEEMAHIMLAHEEGFDPFLIRCIKNFYSNKLLGQQKVSLV